MEGWCIKMSDVIQAIDSVLEYVGSSAWKHELGWAREEFFREFDPTLISDKDAAYGLVLFQDWFLFERELKTAAATPVKQFYQDFSSSFSPEENKIFSALTDTSYGVFKVKRIKAKSVLLASRIKKKRYSVLDSVPEGFRTEGLISARLVELDGKFYFCPAVCFHPQSQTKNILAALKSLDDENKLKQFLYELVHINFKTRLYPDVDPSLFYRELFRAR